MKYRFLTLIITAMAISSNILAQQLDISKFKTFEHELDDVMEIIDTTLLKSKLTEVEQDYNNEPIQINKLRLGIIYHETALNLSFFSKSEYKGYSRKSFDILTEMFDEQTTIVELMPFIAAYRASALSLVSAETKKLKPLGQAFDIFAEAVNKYGEISPLPEFLRGSVAENLPWFLFSKRKHAKRDLQSIISKQEKNSAYASWKIMSFTYWAWANQHQGKSERVQALAYLDKAIALDPDYMAGRSRAEELKSKLK